AASLLAMLIATALVAERPARRASVVGLAVGAGLVVLGVVTYFTAQDALGPLVQQTVLTPLAGRSRGVGAWRYQPMPALRPFPAPLLAALVIDRMPGRARRPALVLATACALAALAVTVRVHRDLRRQYDTPVRTHAGTVWLAAADARPLADLLAYVDAQLRPEDPLPVFPYFPIVQFLAARPAGTSTFYIWPERPPDDTRSEDRSVG